MLKWKITEDERTKLVDSYHELQEESIVTRERLRAEWRKEVEDTTTQLTKHYEQTLALVIAKAKDNQAMYELLVAKCQADAKTAKEALENYRTQPIMDDLRIRILINKFRQQLTTKVEETEAKKIN